MPDAYGRFRGISVPDLPWLRKCEANDEQLARQRSAAERKHELRNRNRDNAADQA